MTEPIYSYVKGQGWVVGVSNDSITVTMAGKHYSLENRKPEVGEMYSGSSFQSRWWDLVNKHPNWDVWREWATTEGMFSTRRQVEFLSTLDFWVTLVPL